MKKTDVSVVGLYILDILGRYMETLPPPGQADFVDEVRLTVAGTAGGTAVDCAKLGLSTRAVGALGDDEKADFMLSTMRGYGIDVDAMARLPDVSTSISMLPIMPSGERRAWFVRGASDRFSPDESTIEAALASPIVHLGGTGLLSAFDGAPSRRFLERAKQAGCTTTLDLIVARPEISEMIDPLMPFTDYFIPSIEETQILTGLKQPEAIADYYLERGADCCVLTMGGDGSFIAHQDGRRHHVPPMPDVDVVDTTGCGDAYSAGFIAALNEGWELEFCGYFATAAAALVATGLGSDAGIVSMADTRQRAEAHYRQA